jgi:anti-anti-sigma factor
MDMHRLSRALIRVEGELDLATPWISSRPTSRSALERNPELLLIDLRDCEFIDSSVITALIRLWRGLTRTTEVVVVARDQPRQVLRLTTVDEVVPVYENIADALHAVNGTGRDRSSQALTSR